MLYLLYCFKVQQCAVFIALSCNVQQCVVFIAFPSKVQYALNLLHCHVKYLQRVAVIASLLMKIQHVVFIALSC